ncbi:MAG: DUF4153 domain-containing protein [Eubacteriales bacterium]|nr:DUF4153 domain-containing protein [Eubacteriales bacterium]
MSRFGIFVAKTFKNISIMALRFPAVLISLAVSMVCVSMLIEGTPWDDDIFGRVIMSCVLTAFLGISTVFFAERFAAKKIIRLLLNIAVLIAGSICFLFFITGNWLWTEFVYLAVICFMLFALFIFIPAYKKTADFGKMAIIHFKSAFTAVLYALVIFAGLGIIYFTIDFLLVGLNENIMLHAANIVFLFFMPLYYLALLPNFCSSEDKERQKYEESAKYPSILAVLVSYILIPIYAVFSGVLAAYIAKIVMTQVWPVGEIGPMVLGYSISGFVLYYLALKPENKFALAFKKLFPFFLIPMIVLQLVSCAIRINAYGVTEPRYFLVLIGIFSICSAAYLIFSKVRDAAATVLIAAIFALISILPGIGAFSVSRMSQTHRLESILERNNMLEGGRLISGSQVSESDRNDISSIVDYMSQMKYLDSLKWFPEKLSEKDSLSAEEFKGVFGFEPYYSGHLPDGFQYYYAMIDPLEQLDIEGYSTFFQTDLYSNAINSEQPELPMFLADFSVGDINFKAYQKTGDQGEAIVEIRRSDFSYVLEISTLSVMENIVQANTGDNTWKGSLPAGQLTVKADGLGISVALVLQQAGIRYSQTDGYETNHLTVYFLVGESQ